MSFRFKISDGKLWKDLMGAVSILIDEACFNFKEEGVFLRMMDPSHVAMVDLSLKKEFFESYSCEKATRLGLSLSEMLRMLKGIRRGEALELFLDEDGRLVIKVEAEYTRIFRIPTLEVREEEVPEPRFTFNATIKLPSSYLKRSFTDAMIASDYVRLEATETGFTIKASGHMGSVSTKFAKESKVLQELSVKEESSASFNLKYLCDMMRASSAISDTVIVEFSKDRPLKLEFKPNENCILGYYLAPRIET